MTFTDIVNEVAERLNLTSATAITRIGRNVNIRHRYVLSSLGMDTSSRTTVTVNTVIGTRYLTFTSVSKLFSVFNAATTPPFILTEVSMDEMRARQVITDPPQTYAIYRMYYNSVIIYLDTTPATIYPLSADAMEQSSTLATTALPAFSENFHDILIEGAMATELNKMEKYSMAQEHEAMFNMRLSELRYFIAKSAYLSRYQSKSNRARPWVAMIAP